MLLVCEEATTTLLKRSGWTVICVIFGWKIKRINGEGRVFWVHLNINFSFLSHQLNLYWTKMCKVTAKHYRPDFSIAFRTVISNLFGLWDSNVHHQLLLMCVWVQVQITPKIIIIMIISDIFIDLQRIFSSEMNKKRQTLREASEMIVLRPPSLEQLGHLRRPTVETCVFPHYTAQRFRGLICSPLEYTHLHVIFKSTSDPTWA